MEGVLEDDHEDEDEGEVDELEEDELYCVDNDEEQEASPDVQDAC